MGKEVEVVGYRDLPGKKYGGSGRNGWRGRTSSPTYVQTV